VVEHLLSNPKALSSICSTTRKQIQERKKEGGERKKRKGGRKREGERKKTGKKKRIIRTFLDRQNLREFIPSRSAL
jgi:hypothetical protein